MQYGGTNWGNLAAPVVYTSYDWGAAISEDRSLTPKFHEIKLQGLFLHATPHYHLAGRVSTGTELSSSSLIFTTHLATKAGQHLYVVRQTTNANTARVDFTLDVKTATGTVTLPGLALNGRESKIIVTEYPFGSSTLRYSTAEIATWFTLDGEDHIVLYASNQTTHTVLPTTSRTKPTITGTSSSITAFLSNGVATISGTAPSGLVRVTVGKTSVWLADKNWIAPRIWQPRVNGTTGTGKYDLSPRTGSVLVFGPYLVRNATISGSTLAIVGDSRSGVTTDLEVLAPVSVKSVTWNDRNIKVSKTSTGTLKGSIVVEDLAPKLPSLKTLEWKCTDSLPEVALGFDDSTWVTANKTTTARPARFQPLGGKTMLYADEYGYHQGNTLYRGRFSSPATGVRLVVQGGSYFGYSAFLNGVFLGSGQSSSDIIEANYTFPAGAVGTDNVLTVVMDNTGIDEENWEGKSKAPRGIRGYELLGGGDFTSWKLIGNVDGEDTKDIIRGPLNQGGLYAERIGALYPTFNFTSTWNSSSTDSSCTPFVGVNKAGITAYKTKFSLNVNETTDLTVSFKFAPFATPATTAVAPISKFAGKVKAGSYIIKLKSGAAKQNHLNLLPKISNSHITYTYDSAFEGYAAQLDAKALEYVQRLSDVEAIYEDGIVQIEIKAIKNEQIGRSAPTEESQFSKRTNGSSVDIYEIGTGIYLQHSQFGGRASWGASFPASLKNVTTDGNGASTAYASLAAGSTYGIATQARLIAVKALSDSGSGSVSDLVAAFNWVISKAKTTGRPSIILTNIGGSASTALDNVVNSAVNSGIHTVVPAGNSNTDASTTSPARVAAAVTVGSVNADGTKT
ncbi:hypothetical protein FRC07_007781, partial [Ceratobasidium sp. 392]